MTITPMISFQAERASVHLGMTHEGAKQRSIVLLLKLEAGEDVESTEKRSLKNVEWSISLLDSTEFNGHATEEQAIGYLSHHPASKSEYDYSAESCYASAAVEPVTFAALWDLVAIGKLPDWLSLTVKDMTYGFDPDGREKIWNVTKNRAVAITEVSIRIPVASSQPQSIEPSEEPDSVQSNLPASSADSRANADRVTKSLAELQASVVRQLRYIVALTVLVAVYIIFK